MKEYQVTLFNPTNQYKPISTIVKIDDQLIITLDKQALLKEIKNKGIIQICNKRYWTGKELIKYQYTKCKIREYNKEKIEEENKARYERIKQERGWIKKKKKVLTSKN